MNTDSNKRTYNIDDVDWAQLASIGILRDELEMAGELDTLLDGGQTGVLTLSLILLGVDVVVDATLQLVHKKGAPIMEIIGITPATEFQELQ